MGHVFDQKLASLYEAWQKSSEGILLDRLSSELIVRLLRPQKRERILDIGCGTGNHLLLFYRLGFDVTGLDASPYMLDIARSRLGHKASLKIGRAEDLPFEDNEFDLATLIITLEFLDDPIEALREAGRVAKNRVFVGVLNSLSYGCMSKKFHTLFHDSIFREARLFNLWGLKSSVKKAHGNVPMEWGSVQVMPFSLRNYTERVETSCLVRSYPFGSFLGLVFKMIYTLRTESLRVTERLKKGVESPTGIPGFFGSTHFYLLTHSSRLINRKVLLLNSKCESGGTGRRTGLRIQPALSDRGSSPLSRTIQKDMPSTQGLLGSLCL